MSRLANYFPERFVKFAFLGVAYQAPSGRFDVDKINEITKEHIGYEIFGYWHFFNDPDAADMMNRDVSNSFHLEKHMSFCYVLAWVSQFTNSCT